MKKIYEVAESVSVSRASVLVTGERGTGKELLARFIHSKSPRCNRRFVTLNCAAVPEGLLESELVGRFEMARESTILLEEISEMALPLQAKLFRVLQEGEMERIGGGAPIRINARILATSNRPLESAVKEGAFREDLYYQLNVIPIHIPPLRTRPRDIEALAQHFVAASCGENGLPVKAVSGGGLEKLRAYSWPGNVRELQNVVERTVLLAPGAEILPGDILLPEVEERAQAASAFIPGMTVTEAERVLIMKTLEFTGQNRTRAAEMLGISIRTLRNKLNEYREADSR
jgi:two-component system response regulator FlrC